MIPWGWSPLRCQLICSTVSLLMCAEEVKTHLTSYRSDVTADIRNACSNVFLKLVEEMEDADGDTGAAILEELQATLSGCQFSPDCQVEYLLHARRRKIRQTPVFPSCAMHATEKSL